MEPSPPSPDRPTVCVTRKLPDAVEERLRDHYEVQLNETDTPMAPEELAVAISGSDALMPTVSDRIDAALLNGADRRVRVIANVGVGFNNIDVGVAGELGVAVSNTPDVLTDATADIALLLILASTRRAFAGEQKLRAGRWEGFSLVEGLGTSVQGKVLGIVGMGRIGRATARRAVLGLGMSVVFFSRSPVTDLDFPATQVHTLAEVMTAADVVSIHVPGGAAPLVDAEHLAMMKPDAHLVNTARGDSVDQAALVAALRDGRIAGAGLDVFDGEPSVPEELRAMDQVTLLPHIGSATTEVRTAMGMLAVDNLDAFFAGDALPNRVA